MEESSNQTQPPEFIEICYQSVWDFFGGKVSGLKNRLGKVISSKEVFAEKKYGDYHVDIPTAQCNSASVSHLIICRLPLGCCGGYS